MASSHPPDDVVAQQQLDTLNASLTNAEEQLKAQGDALLQRSKLKTTLGDHAGALNDAKRALALFPEHPQVSIAYVALQLNCRGTTLTPLTPCSRPVSNLYSLGLLAQRTLRQGCRTRTKGTSRPRCSRL